VNANPDTRQFPTGLDALAAHYEAQRARRERARQALTARAAAYQDPGLVISTTLIRRRRIPEHVNEILARPTWQHEDEAQDQRKLLKPLVRIAYSLLLRGYDAEQFLDMMPGYTPPPAYWRYCNDQIMRSPRQNILWEELTTRGRRYRDPTQLVLQAFKFAQENLDRGVLPDKDKPTYIEALITHWDTEITAGRVRLTKTEAKVLGYLTDQMRRRGFLKIACPCRQVAKEVGITDRTTAWAALKLLADDGVLILHSKGVGTPGGKANVYSLSPEVPAGRVAPGGPPRATRSRNQGQGENGTPTGLDHPL
jgi:hypothetical protein